LKNITQNLAQPIFVKIKAYQTFAVEKVAQKWTSVPNHIKLPKVKDGSIVENLPNLVTLLSCQSAL
jgi:hypothetical protein